MGDVPLYTHSTLLIGALPRIQEQPLHRNVQRFRVGHVFKAHGLLYHSTLGLRIIKKGVTPNTVDLTARGGLEYPHAGPH